MKVSVRVPMAFIVAISAQSHEVSDNIFALASTSNVVYINGFLIAQLAGHKIINAVAKVIEVDFNVALHSLIKNFSYSYSIIAIILSLSFLSG